MTTPDDETPLAAELALGVLEGDERAAALRRMLAEPGFAREVETWRAHFALLFAQWPDAIPDDGVEGRVVRSLDPPTGQAAARGNVWAWAAGAATLIAACLVLALALRPQRIVTVPVPAPTAAQAAAPLMAALTPTKDGAGGEAFAAIYDPQTGEIRLAGGVAVPHGRSAELWAIGKDGPHALGVLAGSDKSRVTVGGGNVARMTAGVTLAVSIEPVGGSPSGLPTGPVVATGVFAKA